MTSPDLEAIVSKLSDFTFKLRVLRYLLQNGYEEWREGVWKRELDASCCCDGRECGCGGETVREMWSWHVQKEQSK